MFFASNWLSHKDHTVKTRKSFPSGIRIPSVWICVKRTVYRKYCIVKSDPLDMMWKLCMLLVGKGFSIRMKLIWINFCSLLFRGLEINSDDLCLHCVCTLLSTVLKYLLRNGMCVKDAIVATNKRDTSCVCDHIEQFPLMSLQNGRHTSSSVCLISFSLTPK